MNGRSLCVCTLAGLGIVLAGAAAAHAEGEYGYVGAWVEGGRCGSDAAATGIREYSAGPGEDAGYGTQSVDSNVSTFPMTGPIGSSVAGWAGGNADAAVDPVARSIAVRSHAYSSGRGPARYEVNFMGSTMYVPWGPTFGAAFSRGYFSNMIHVEPGGSGLHEGDAVQLALNLGLSGNVALNSVKSWDPEPTVYLGSQVTDITDAEAYELQYRELMWTGRETPIHLGSNTYSADQLDRVAGYYHVSTANMPPFVAESMFGEFPKDAPLLIEADGDVAHDSGEILIDAVVGRWYLLEAYLECDMALPNHPDEYTEEMGIDPETGFPIYSPLYGTADFMNTMECELAPAAGYEDIALVNAIAPQVPEPATLGLLVAGGLALLRRRAA